MPRWLVATSAAACGLTLAGVLGIAGAQTTTTPAPPAPAPRTVTANGAGGRDVPANAPVADVKSAYSASLADAIDDAKAKADALAAKTGLTLGAAQAVTEQTNTPLAACDSGPIAYAKGGAVQERRTVKPKKPTRRRKAASKRAIAPSHDGPGTCTVAAGVTVTYAVAG
jgi:Protein of unknown function (DUF541)